MANKYFLLCIPAAILAVSACQSNNSTISQKDQEIVAQAEDNSFNNEHFQGRDVYLRGEMNDYSIQRSYRLRKFAEDKYCTLAPLRSDWSPYRFKFADALWTDGTNFGYAYPPAVIREGSAKMLLNPSSRFEELRYEPSTDGIYRFCIEYEDDKPFVTVTHLVEGKLTTMDEIIQAEINADLNIQGKTSEAESEPQAQNLTIKESLLSAARTI